MKNIKILLLLILTISLASCGTDKESEKIKLPNWVTTEDISDNTSGVINEDVDDKSKEYGDLTEYIDTNLSDEKIEELKTALSDRKVRQELIKTTLTKALKNWTIEKWLEEAKVMRAACAARISKYVAEDKIEDFKKYCASLDKKLVDKFLPSNNNADTSIEDNNKEKEELKKSPIEDIRIYNWK